MAQYGFYYDGMVKGMDGPVNKPAKDISISGIDTPDDSTIAFDLRQATVDFLYRLAMPAASPMPAESRAASTRPATTAGTSCRAGRT